MAYFCQKYFYMIKLLSLFLKFIGYDLTKSLLPFKYYKGNSDVVGLDYHPTPIGNYYLPTGSKSDGVASFMKRGMYFEKEVIDLANRFIKPGTLVLDIGANFGQMSIAFSKMVGKEGKVYSFEAQKLVYGVLENNLKANGCNNVKPYFNAVFDKHGETFVFPAPDFSVTNTYGSFGLDPTKKTGEPVDSITIDRLDIKEPISFIKIDIQGSDIFAMRGAKETIMKNKVPVLFEFEQEFQAQFSTTFQDYVDFVNEINYKFVETILDINFLIVPK